jgi:hypothetical protein
MFGALSSRAAAVYEAQCGKHAERASLSGLVDGVKQFFAIATRLDDGAESLTRTDISQLGDYALNLLAEFGALVGSSGETDGAFEVSPVILAVAGWIIRRDGRIGTLEPVVDALADTANHTTDGPARTRKRRRDRWPIYISGGIYLRFGTIIKIAPGCAVSR